MFRILLLFSVFFILSISCSKKNEANSELNQTELPEKKIQLDNKTFTELWSILDSLKSFRKFETAYIVSQYILKKGITEQSDIHSFKAITNIISTQQLINPDNELLTIEFVESLVDSSTGILNSLITSMAAELNARYYFKNEKKISHNNGNRNSDKVDWKQKIFLKHIQNLYEKSLISEDILKLTDTELYKEVFIYNQKTKKNRPTLFNLLSHRALNFYSDIMLSKKEVSAFKQSDLINIDSFLKLKIEPNSIEASFIKTYQELLKFNLKHQYIYALVESNLNRLEFYKKQVYLFDKSIYLKSLYSFLEDHRKHPASALISVQIISTLIDEGLFTQARHLVTKSLRDFPNSLVSDELRQLKNEIDKPKLLLEFESKYISTKDINFKLFHRFIKRILIRFTPITLNSFLKAESDDLTNDGQNAPIVKELNLSINKSDNLIELKLLEKKLPAGIYSISTNYYDIDNKEYQLSDQFFNITNQGFLSRRLAKNLVEFYFFESESGKPLSNQQIEIKSFNSETDQYDLVESFLTDRQGFARDKFNE